MPHLAETLKFLNFGPLRLSRPDLVPSPRHPKYYLDYGWFVTLGARIPSPGFSSETTLKTHELSSKQKQKETLFET